MSNRRFATASFGLLVSVMFLSEANAMYAPSIGRFMSRDPIGYEGSPNCLYAYTNAMPLNAVDPLGNEASRFPLEPKFPEAPINPDGTPHSPLNPDHPDYETPWPEDLGSDPKNVPSGPGDGGGCTCNLPHSFNRQRPPDKNGVWPVPGKASYNCNLGDSKTYVYYGSCSNGPCCSLKVCGQVTRWLCEARKGKPGGTEWLPKGTTSFGCR